jgi:hypothetical protein
LSRLWRTFFDDPQTKLLSWFIEREQRQMREVIRRKYRNSLDPQVYWITGSIHEHTGLSDDPVERHVQRLSLSQIGVFLAQRIWARRLWIVTPAVFILSLVLGYSLLNVAAISTSARLAPVLCAVIVWIGLMLSFGATFFQPLVAQWCLPRTPVRQDEIDSVRNVMARCVVRAVDVAAPPDLRDRLRIAVTDAEGQAVAGQVLATDLEYSAVRAEWFNSREALFVLGLAFMAPAMITLSAWLALLAWCSMQRPVIVSTLAALNGNREHRNGLSGHLVKLAAVLAIVLFLLAPLLLGFLDSHLSGKLSIGALGVQWSFVALMWFFALRHILRMRAPLAFRALQLDQAVRETGTELLIDKAGREHFVQLEMARIEQVDNARDDTQRQHEAYAKAQALIARSPFRGLPVDKVPPGPEGKAYLDALKVMPPPRLEHQQLEAGALNALGTYRTALEVETLAANIEHQFDVQVNGKKAAPARTVLAPYTPENTATPTVLPPSIGAGAAKQDEVLSGYFGSKASGTEPVVASSHPATTTEVDVTHQIEAERQRELAAQQTKERAEQQRQLAAQQARDRAQQAALLRQQQAAQAQLAQQQAARAAAAEKVRACTSSLFSRAVCASQGYNPLTGQK